MRSSEAIFSASSETLLEQDADPGRTVGHSQRVVGMQLRRSARVASATGERSACVLCAPQTARIWSPRKGVQDVAVAGFWLRRGRVIWSVSTTIRETVLGPA